MKLPKVKYSPKPCKTTPKNKPDDLINFMWENRKLVESELARAAIERFINIAPKTIVSKIAHKKEIFAQYGFSEAPKVIQPDVVDVNTKKQMGVGGTVVRQDAVPDIAEILISIKNDLALHKIQIDELINIQNQTLDLFKTINKNKSGGI